MAVLLFCQDQNSVTVLLGSGLFYCSVRIRTALLFCGNQKARFTVLFGWDGQLYCSVITRRVLLFCQDQDSFTVLLGSEGQLYCSVRIRRTDLLFCQDQKDSFTFLLGSEKTALLCCQDQKDRFTVLSGSGQIYILWGSEGQLYCSVWMRGTALASCQDQLDSYTISSGLAGQFYHPVRISRAVLPFYQDLLDSFTILSGSADSFTILSGYDMLDSFTILSGSAQQFYHSVRICWTVLPFCQDQQDSVSALSGWAGQQKKQKQTLTGLVEPDKKKQWSVCTLLSCLEVLTQPLNQSDIYASHLPRWELTKSVQ